MTREHEDAYDFRLEHVLLPTGHELNKRQTSRDELFALFGHCAPYADRSLPLAQYHAQDTFLADRAREQYKEKLSNAGVRVRYKRATEDLWSTVTVTWGDLAESLPRPSFWSNCHSPSYLSPFGHVFVPRPCRFPFSISPSYWLPDQYVLEPRRRDMASPLSHH